MKKHNLTSDSSSDIPFNLPSADKLNQHFSNAYNTPCTVSNSKMNFYNNNKHPLVTGELEFRLVDEVALLDIIDSISSNAVGEDQLSIKDLRLCLPFCKGPLVNILNSCILEHYLPNIWKKSIIKPIPKTSKCNDLEDLRPISILPVVSKILEKHIYNEIIAFTNNCDFIPDCQSGFRRSCSTSTCLIDIIDQIKLNMENGQGSCLALLDFSKAFDTLDHGMMLAKLKYFGFSEGSVEFFRSYLTGRSHCVRLRTDAVAEKSNFVPCGRGVPQGSVLGPLLFLIYVADMNEAVLHSDLRQYADDSQLYIPLNFANLSYCEEKFNDDLLRVSQFAIDHNLRLNASKSCVIMFGVNGARVSAVYDNFRPQLGGSFLPIASDARNLGVYLDSDLSFRVHVKNRLRMAYARLRKLYRFKTSLSSRTKYYLCNSLVLSLFDYADVVYGDSLSLGTGKSIQKLQNSCMRFSFMIPYREHITPHLNQHSLLNMANRRRLHMLVFVRRILGTGRPSYLRRLFCTRSHRYPTRNLGDFVIPQHRTEVFHRSFQVVAPRMWNELPDDVKQLSIKKFKREVEKLCLEKQRHAC